MRLIYLENKVIKQDKEIVKLENNQDYYINVLNDSIESNRVLKLNINDFKHSNNKMIQELDSIRKVSKIKDKQLNQASLIISKLKDSIRIPLPKPEKDTITINDCYFKVFKQYNDETSFEVSRDSIGILIIPDITNRQSLFIKDERVYRNYRKNFFDRLFHWDWKKKNIYDFKIVNSNKAIKIEESILIDLNE